MIAQNRINWTRRALADFDRHLFAIATVDTEAAARAELAVEDKVELLAHYPHIGSPLYRGLRKTIVTGTRLVIVYGARADGIDIVRVHHERQDWR